MSSGDDRHHQEDDENRYVDYSSVSMRAQQALEQRQEKLKKLAKQLEEKYGNGNGQAHRPKKNEYEFREKRSSFYESVDDQIKRRQEMLEQNEIRKAQEELSQATFRPQISLYSQMLDRGDEPVHERLFRISKTINDRKKVALSSQSNPPSAAPSPRRMPGELPAEERMYREAEEMRERKEQQLRAQELELQRQRQQKILTERSEEMARAKQERELRNVFREVAQKLPDHISFIELGSALRKLGLFNSSDRRDNEEEARIQQSLWEVMDEEEAGWVHVDSYLRVMLPIMTSTEDVEDEEIRMILRRLQREIKTLHVNKFAYAKTRNVRNRSRALEDSVVASPRSKPRRPRVSVEKKNRSGNDESEADGAPSSNDSEQAVDPYQKLLHRKKITEEQLEQKRRQIEQERMQECTFAPRITESFNARKRDQENAGRPRYEVLYRKAAQYRRSDPTLTLKEKKELAECTFQPNRSRTRNFISTRKPVQSRPKGFDQVIERMRKAQQRKQELKETEEAMMKARNWTNERTKPKPFEFELDRRQRQRAMLYMDVNLGPGRMGRIGIHQGDDPEVVAMNFAKSYSLDDILTKRLEELVRENMIQNGIAIGKDGSSQSQDQEKSSARPLSRSNRRTPQQSPTNHTQGRSYSPISYERERDTSFTSQRPSSLASDEDREIWAVKAHSGPDDGNDDTSDTAQSLDLNFELDLGEFGELDLGPYYAGSEND